MSSYTYDGEGRILTAKVEADAVTEAAVTSFTYDNNGNISTITDPMGNVTRLLQYDNQGNMLAMQDPRGNPSNFTYDDLGRLVSQTDPLGQVTSYEYDGANNRTAVINTLLKRFDFEYDDHNNLIKAIDPTQKYSTIEYNTDELPVRAKDQEGKESQSEYDNEGRLLKQIDGAGNQVKYYYDETLATYATSEKPVRIEYPTYTRRLYYDRMQRKVRQVDVLDENTSLSTAYVFDATGNVSSKTDSEGRVTTFEYDALNRLVKTTDPLGGVIERSYDDRGNLLNIKDPNLGITQYAYDKNNRVTKLTRPLGEVTTYSYDAAGNRTAVVDAKGQKIAYEYDELNRVRTVRHFAAGDYVNPVRTVGFTYDALGNLSSYDDGTTSGTYTYDDLRRKLSETVNYGPFSLAGSYSYYGNGLKKSFTGPDGITYDYAYDAGNRPAGIDVPGQGRITYNTYQWNSPTRITLPGNTVSEYTYDPLMQLKSINVMDRAANSVLAYGYEHSAVGNITAKNTEHGNYGYQYDGLSRLTTAANAAADAEAYTYDPLGNRKTSSAVPGDWTYNANNELLDYGEVTFEYDANGNTTKRTTNEQGTNYVYDTVDRLIQVTEDVGGSGGEVVADYAYDPFGRRLWKEVGGVRTYFLYADEGLIGEYDEGGAEIKSYGYAPGSSWTTDPLFQKVGDSYYWYVNDHLGTPQKLVDVSGLVVWAATYDAFGNALVAVEKVENNLRFPGQYYDAETGLYYNWNRYYDPRTGRYLRMDPLGDGLNLYAYAFGNPVGAVDPEGLCVLNNLQGGVSFMPSDAEYVFGINGGSGPLAAGSPYMKFLERLPNMHQTALFHDATVDFLKTGVKPIDDFFNWVTMYPAYKAARMYNIATTSSQMFNSVSKIYRWSFENLTVPRLLNEFKGSPFLDPSTWDSFRRGELPNPLPFGLKFKTIGEPA